MNPYAPPGARVADVETAKKGSAIKAVIIGAVADSGGSILMAQVLTFIYAASIARPGITEEEVVSSLLAASATPSSWLFIAGIILGSLCSVLGGYLCARIARHSEYRLGGIVVLISVTMGFILGGKTQPISTNLLLALLTAGCIVAGVRLGVRKTRAEIRR